MMWVISFSVEALTDSFSCRRVMCEWDRVTARAGASVLPCIVWISMAAVQQCLPCLTQRLRGHGTVGHVEERIDQRELLIALLRRPLRRGERLDRAHGHRPGLMLQR